jgi:hypothetical protein
MRSILVKKGGREALPYGILAVGSTPITSEYEWAKAMKADLLIIVRRVAWKFSEGELTELYRLWRHWCAEVERLAPGPSGS